MPSCGASATAQLQVLAVHRPRYNDWSWPKGKLIDGETLPQCAIREVAEETGREIVLGQPLPTLRYPIGAGKQKVVRYWAAQVIWRGVAGGAGSAPREERAQA